MTSINFPSVLEVSKFWLMVKANNIVLPGMVVKAKLFTILVFLEMLANPSSML